MELFLYILFFVSCIVLVAAVLLQPGKTDAGALFTSNVSNTNYQPRGAQSVLSKITIVAATTFMLSALLLSLPALTGNVSVMQTTDDQPALESNTNTAVNANVQTNANAVNANVATTAPANTAEEKPAEETKPAEESKPAEEGKPVEANTETKE